MLSLDDKAITGDNMNAAYGLYQELISECRSLSGAIEYALTRMQGNGSRCSIGDGYHVFMFDDGSALKLDKNGIEMAGR
jgi:hypothetical protein